MTINVHEFIQKWVDDVSKLLLLITRDLLGYEPTGNYIKPAANNQQLLNTVSLPDAAKIFYSICDEVDLPDIYNGYFIMSIDLVINRPSNPKLGIPRYFAPYDSWQDVLQRKPIVTFGSDGGGSCFAFGGCNGEEILYLPSDGAMHDGVFTYLSKYEEPFKIADNMIDFLVKLKQDVEAFIQGDENWKYMIP